MRTHSEIIRDAGVDQTVADQLGAKKHQVRDWRLRDSIPSEWWEQLAKAEFAHLEELAAAAAAKRLTAA